MEGLSKLSTLLIMCILLTGPMISEASISCDAVIQNLSQCVNYLVRGGFVTRGCCYGIQRLKNMAKTTSDRRQACRCIQGAAKSMGSRLNQGRVARLPGACHVKISFPISARTNCDNIM
ncbi:unnamed protein product [Cochlearia groenlandica]